MSVLTDIVLARASEAEAVLTQHPQRTWPHISANGLGPLQLGDLYALLAKPEADALDLSDAFQPIASDQSDDEGPWVMPWPERFTALLAELPLTQTTAIAQQWLACDEPPDWPQAALVGLLNELVPLAQQVQQAKAEPMALMLWVSL
jgi:hypothetical protein